MALPDSTWLYLALLGFAWLYLALPGNKERKTKPNLIARAASRSRFMNNMKARKNAELPFFRLPLELRYRIYEFVCGGQTIHIKQRKLDDRRKLVLSHSLCSATWSEEEAQEKFDNSNAVWYALETVDRHSCCYPPTFNPDCPNCSSRRFFPELRPDKLETNFLRCCQQMYSESRFVPYYANTFSFRSGDSLSEFCRQISKPCKNMVRSLHVELRIDIYDNYRPGNWDLAFQLVASSLKGLQRIFITIELFPDYKDPPYQSQDWVEKPWLNHILQAGKLNLKVATVVLCDSHLAEDSLNVYYSDEEIEELESKTRWTLAQKQEWSRWLRKALLHYEDRDSILANFKREALEQGRICRL